MKFIQLDHSGDNMQRFGRSPSVNAGPFERFKVIVNEYCKTTSRRLLSRSHEPMKNDQCTGPCSKLRERGMAGCFWRICTEERKFVKGEAVSCV